MAGINQPPESNSPDPRQPERGPSGDKLTGKTFSCTNCGASITVRYMGHSLRVVCESCKSILDSTDPNLRIIEKHFKVTKEFKPKLLLGSRGKLKGKEWEVIGFMVRQDVASYYTWQEYLLFNPFYGYRWLALNNGHWSFVTTTKKKPLSRQHISGGSTSGFRFEDNQYKLYHLGRARVIYVIGEFYWNVRVNNEVSVADYIAPPYMLSMEGDANEIVWSQSEYIESSEVHGNFPIDQIPYAVGVAPNQISKWSEIASKMNMAWLAFIAIAFCIQFVQVSGASNDRVFSKSFDYQTNVKNPTVTTEPFEIPKKKGNLEIHFRADVDNSWFFTYCELVNNETDATYSFEKTLEFYHGYDDGYWSEGSKKSKVLISGVPGGKYYLNLYTQSGDYKKPGFHRYSVEIVRNVPMYANFILAFILLSLAPSVVLFMSYSDEVARWEDSDFSPYASSDY